MGVKEERIRALTNLIEEAQRQLGQLDVVPATDEYPDGTMIRLVVQNGTLENATLTYLLLKVERRYGDGALWYHTGQRYVGKAGQSWGNVAFKGWDELHRWALRSDHTVISWDRVYTGEEINDRCRGEEARSQQKGEPPVRAEDLGWVG